MGRGWGVRAERLQSTGSRRGISRTLGNLLDNEEFLYVHESTHDHSISVLRDGNEERRGKPDGRLPPEFRFVPLFLLAT
jgi:hypothetical protein